MWFKTNFLIHFCKQVAATRLKSSKICWICGERIKFPLISQIKKHHVCGLFVTERYRQDVIELRRSDQFVAITVLSIVDATSL